MPASQNQTQTAGAANVTTGAQIYDAIMSQIEPELVSGVAGTLDEKYKNESPADHKQRMERYKKAFALYDKCFGAFVVTLTDESKKTKLSARRAAEAKSRVEEEQAEEGLLSQIDSL